MQSERAHRVRHLVAAVTCWAAVTGCVCASQASEPSAGTIEQIDRALAAGSAFLLGTQSPDGAWRSEVYGAFKEGDALTPLALTALLAASRSDEQRRACERAAAYLAAMVSPDGTIMPGRFGLAYPVYTAAGTVSALSDPALARHRAARDAWLRFLRERQLTNRLGWEQEDANYGGWSYANDPPRKPPPGELQPPANEANLSATIFALEALRAAGCSANDPAVHDALGFVKRCQNFGESDRSSDRGFNDGGFFFIPTDTARNKAGAAGRDSDGVERFFSYGSATADGLRALVACGLPLDDERVVAAQAWLTTQFRGDAHPGTYADNREQARPSLYFYYASSAAGAIRAAGLNEITISGGAFRPATALAQALIERQRVDGSWSNTAVDVREDDPLVATSLAIQALATCRATLLR